jgi:hypothetical protein
MGSGAVIYVPSFIKIGSGIQKLIGGIHRHTHRQQGDLISLLLFFQNKESRLKNPSHQSVCLYVCPPIVARKRLGNKRYRGNESTSKQ